jgi:predicted nucleic acid-binding protein
VRFALNSAHAGLTSYWDGLLIAAAAEDGCTAILTEDMSYGAVHRGVRIVHPFGKHGITDQAMRLLAPAG